MAPAGSTDVSQAYYGTPDSIIVRDNGNFFRGGLAPVFTCDPRLPGTKNGEKFLDINCIGFPAFGAVGDVLPPYVFRTPTRMTHDLTLFKNFPIKGDQKLQFRVGLFNIFNQAFATPRLDRNDMVLSLNTTCNVTASGVPNGDGGTANDVCDAAAGLLVHAGHADQLRQDQHPAGPPHRRARVQVLLLDAGSRRRLPQARRRRAAFRSSALFGWSPPVGGRGSSAEGLRADEPACPRRVPTVGRRPRTRLIRGLSAQPPDVSGEPRGSTL